jgi:mRNA-degrading endonuclease RelE of RelBE toxin-antitoxin system
MFRIKTSSAIEESYSKQLQKLAKKIRLAEKEQVGEFSDIWGNIFKDISNTATDHAQLAATFIEEIEKPCRQMNDNTYFQKVKAVRILKQSNLV